MGFFRGLFASILVSVVSIAFCQQGQGQGGGGFGGGFGGGSSDGGFGGGGFGGGNMSQDSAMQRSIFPGKKNETGEISSWISKSIILTPGDKVEWKFNAKPGQVIFATAESDTFDPAIAVVDSEGKVLTENDDQYEGEQSPYVSAVIRKEGEYKLLIRNYRSTSGGRFTLYTKLATCLNATIGNNLLEIQREQSDRGNQFFVSIHAEKGKHYGFLASSNIFKNASSVPSFDRLIGPSGVPLVDQVEFQSISGNFVFEAKQTGDYLVRGYLGSHPSVGPNTIGVSFNTIEVEKVSLDGSAIVSLLPGHQKILQFDVKEGTALRSKISRPFGFADQLNLPKGKLQDDYRAKQLIWIPMRTNDLNEGVRVYPNPGTVNHVICNFGDKPGTFQIENSTKFPTLAIGSKISDRLSIGEAKMYSITGSNLDIQRLRASSSQMEVTIDILQDDMRRWVFVDAQNHAPQTILTFDAQHTILLTVSSQGRGGSGEYSVDYSKIEPIKASLGAIFTINNPSDYANVYEIKLDNDTDYILVLKGMAGALSITGPDGERVPITALTNGPVASRFIHITNTGTYRMRFTDAINGSKVKIEKYVPPVIAK